jgi:hypothetical protein
MLAVVLVGVALLAPKFDFYADKPYDPAIPKPDATLGYAIGDRHTNFRDQERALFAIASAAGKRVKVIDFGKSWEGRPLRIYAVSSPENMARLEDIRKNNQARAEGKSVGGKDPALVWVNECIHGDETASFESAMPLLYNLAASRGERIKTMLDNVVVLLNPCYNPDGHERYVVYYNSIATGSSEPGAYEMNQPPAISGRLNHYRFDMNRDRVAMSQIETRQEVAEFLRWHPQVYIDQHGQVETYFFPPNAMSQNVNVDRARVDKWTEIFGRATGKAFDEHGWTYFVKDTFDLYYPGYLDSFTTLSGAIGMTHETDGGRVLAQGRADGTILTMRDGVVKHFTSALAVAETASQKHTELIASFMDFRQKAVSGKAAGKFQRVIVAGDIRTLLRLEDHLHSMGINVTLASKPFSATDAHDYWSSIVGTVQVPASSLIIDMAQPQGQLAKSMFEPGSDFESEFSKAQLNKKKTAPEGENYPGPEGTEFYDTTAWALPYAYNLKAWWCESAPNIPVRDTKLERLAIVAGKGMIGIFPKDPIYVGYAMPYSDDEDILKVFRALQAGIHVSVATHEIKVGGQALGAGTFLFLAARNEDGYEKTLGTVVNLLSLIPLTTSYPDSGRQGLGNEGIIQLRMPKIGVVFGSGSNMGQVGSIWYLMDQVFHLPFTALSSGALGGDLSKYTCIVVPSGTGASVTTKLREWVSSGGCVVALGGLGWATGGSGFVELASVGGDHEDLPGALFRADLDPRSFLSYGYGSKQIAVPVAGNDFLKVRKEGGSVVRFGDDSKIAKLLSGWSWPDDTEKAIAGSVWLQDAPVGRGHAVLFTYDPTARAMWPGLYKLLLNAMVIGPSA